MLRIAGPTNPAIIFDRTGKTLFSTPDKQYISVLFSDGALKACRQLGFITRVGDKKVKVEIKVLKMLNRGSHPLYPPNWTGYFESIVQIENKSGQITAVEVSNSRTLDRDHCTLNRKLAESLVSQLLSFAIEDGLSKKQVQNALLLP